MRRGFYVSNRRSVVSIQRLLIMHKRFVNETEDYDIRSDRSRQPFSAGGVLLYF